MDYPSLTAEEARVIGSMVEKAMTTPDNYPLSLNAVTTACNQVSNRDPIVEYEERTVELILRGLADRGLAKMVHRPGDRVVKYRHAIDAALHIDNDPLALLAVLLLRGPQTPGELRQRISRYVQSTGLPEVEVTLEDMRLAGLVRRLERRPGQKEHRYIELISPHADRMGPDEGPEPAVVEWSGPELVDTPRETVLDDVGSLRSELDDLRLRFEMLLEQLGVDDI